MSSSQKDIEQRLRRVEDIETIRKLKARYARALDDRYNPEAVAALFSDQGRWLVKGKAGGDKSFFPDDNLRPDRSSAALSPIRGVEGAVEGREAIKNHCRNLKSDISWTFHNINPHIIEIELDGQEAQGNFYFQGCQTMKNESGEDEAYVLLGEYEDKFVKIGDDWFFEEILATVLQVAPWSEGWVKGSFKPNFFDVR